MVFLYYISLSQQETVISFLKINITINIFNLNILTKAFLNLLDENMNQIFIIMHHDVQAFKKLSGG